MKNVSVILKTVMLLLAGAVMGIYVSDTSFNGRGFTFNKNNKLSRVLSLVRDKYVDSVNVDSLEGETVNQFLQNLDPHSLYLAPQRALSMSEHLEGGFDGIGIEYELVNNTLYVTQVYADGPAAKAGLLGGDRIIKLNGQQFSGNNLNAERVNEAFKDASNTPIELQVSRNGSAVLKTIEVQRGHVTLSSIDAAYMVAPATGYVKISQFASNTDRDFKIAVKKLQADGMKKLVLDLRGNGGGYLNAATAIADEFLPAGKLIMFTKGVHEPRTDYISTDSGMFKNGKLAVMIDEYSASASEILAGAMQDLDRATIVGRRSFGKGLVQEQFAFGDGSAVNLTVARYYTPSGRSIQKSYKNGLENYRNELAKRMKKGELFSAKSNMDDSLFQKPSKFHTAKGRQVYSGGGIMPDVFVPANISGNTTLFYDLNKRQLFMAYVLQKMQPVLKHYPTYRTFDKGYVVSEDIFNDFLLYANRTLKEMDSHEIRQSHNIIKLYLKATAARFKWGDEAYFKIINQNDATLAKAVSVCK